MFSVVCVLLLMCILIVFPLGRGWAWGLGSEASSVGFQVVMALGALERFQANGSSTKSSYNPLLYP